jgi:type VI protein secretion system component Hcp
MTIKMFLNIDQVPGEAQDKDYKDTIEVQGWNWGVSQTTPNLPSPGTSAAT